MLFSFLKPRQPRQFDYRPRYYDPEAEEREQKKKAILGEDYRDRYKKPGEGTSQEKDYVPGQYARDLHLRRGILAQRQKSTLRRRAAQRRTMIFAVLLLAVIYWLFFM